MKLATLARARFETKTAAVPTQTTRIPTNSQPTESFDETELKPDWFRLTAGIAKDALVGAQLGAMNNALFRGNTGLAAGVYGGAGAAIGSFGGLIAAGLEKAANGSNHQPDTLKYCGILGGGAGVTAALLGGAATALANVCGGGIIGGAVAGAIVGAVSRPVALGVFRFALKDRH